VEIPLYIIIFILLAMILVLILRRQRTPDTAELEQKLRFALASADSVKEIRETLDGLPRNVLESITRSLGKRTGKLNELLATFELTHYDRLFYLGEPVDFVGIKYGEGVDFIEVKTGRARLSDDEKRLKELVDAKLVYYLPLSVQKVGIAEQIEGEDIDYESG